MGAVGLLATKKRKEDGMDGQRPQYMKLAWGDVRASAGWKSKCFRLGLVSLIPVFGDIVRGGYAYGWARDVAWGVREPLPAEIFGNEDGRLYSRGFYVFVLMLVCTLAPWAASSLLSAVTGMHGVAYEHFWSGHGLMPLFWASSAVGVVAFAVSVALAVAASVFALVGALRISIYDRMSAGFQFSKVWAMVRRDTRGIISILGWSLLLTLLVSLAVFTVAMIVVVTLVTVVAVAVGAMSYGGADAVGSSMAAALALCAVAFVGLALALALAVASTSAYSALSLVTARAVGLWGYQFDVASWRGQDDPLPFESHV